MAVHFVGFRENDEYLHAVMVFGKPDFIHLIHDRRMYREVSPDDTIVFGSRGHEKIPEYNGDDIREI